MSYLRSQTGLGRVTGDTGFVRRTGEAVIRQRQTDANRSRLLAQAEADIARQKAILDAKENAVDRVITNLETTGRPGAISAGSLLSSPTALIVAAAVVGFLALRN